METYVYFAVSATVSRLLPIGLGLYRRRELDRAAVLVVVFVALSLLGDIVMLLLGKGGARKNNLWVSHLLIAVQTPVLLLAFASWARQEWLQRGIRVASAVAVVGWLVLTIALESPDRFARFTAPLQAAAFCLAAIALLVQRGLAAEGPLSREAWFWTALAILVLYGLTAVYRPLLDLFTTRGVTAIPIWTVLKVNAVLQIAANVFFARALFLTFAPRRDLAPAPA